MMPVITVNVQAGCSWVSLTLLWLLAFSVLPENNLKVCVSVYKM